MRPAAPCGWAPAGRRCASPQAIQPLQKTAVFPPNDQETACWVHGEFFFIELPAVFVCWPYVAVLCISGSYMLRYAARRLQCRHETLRHRGILLSVPPCPPNGYNLSLMPCFACRVWRLKSLNSTHSPAEVQDWVSREYTASSKMQPPLPGVTRRDRSYPRPDKLATMQDLATPKCSLEHCTRTTRANGCQGGNYNEGLRAPRHNVRCLHTRFGDEQSASYQLLLPVLRFLHIAARVVFAYTIVKIFAACSAGDRREQRGTRRGSSKPGSLSGKNPSRQSFHPSRIRVAYFSK